MRRASRIFLLVLAAGMPACGGEAMTDTPTCGDGFASRADQRADTPAGPCSLRAHPTGVVVLLPSVSPDSAWKLSGRVDDDPFTCAFEPGMVEGDACSDNPLVDWFSTGVRLRAHPCQLSLQFEVDGEEVASGTFEPTYDWSEPNGEGCGWTARTEVVLAPEDA